MTAIKALLFPSKESNSHTFLKFDLLVRNSFNYTKQVGRSRSIIVASRCTSLAERSSGVVVRREDDSF